MLMRYDPKRSGLLSLMEHNLDALRARVMCMEKVDDLDEFRWSR